VAQLTEQFWIEVIKSGPIGFATAAGAFATLVASLAAVVQNWRLKKNQDTIKVQTDGKLREILALYQAERDARLAETAAREQLQTELDAAYAILSARAGKPVMNIRDIARAEDFGERPKPGGNGGPKRRRLDEPPLLERKEDDES
jgi:hypothetical protein